MREFSFTCLLVCSFVRHNSSLFLVSSTFAPPPLPSSKTQAAAFTSSGGTALGYVVERDGRRLFLKRLRPELTDKSRYRRAFEKEYELGIRLQHPGIAYYHGCGSDEHGAYILVDYVDGLPLDRFVEENPTYFNSRAARRRFAEQLLSAVECLHQHQVLHLDLSPANVLITTQAHDVKLIDLGMSFHDSYTTTYGGTAGYSAPEVLSAKASGTKPTPAADVYSIGQLLRLIGCQRTAVLRRCSQALPTARYATVAELPTDTVVHVRYAPDRRLTLRRLFDGRYRVDAVSSGKLQAGDLLRLTSVTRYAPFAVEDVERDGNSLGPYTGGVAGGVETFEVEGSAL